MWKVCAQRKFCLLKLSHLLQAALGRACNTDFISSVDSFPWLFSYGAFIIKGEHCFSPFVGYSDRNVNGKKEL